MWMDALTISFAALKFTFMHLFLTKMCNILLSSSPLTAVAVPSWVWRECCSNISSLIVCSGCLHSVCRDDWRKLKGGRGWGGRACGWLWACEHIYIYIYITVTRFNGPNSQKRIMGLTESSLNQQKKSEHRSASAYKNVSLKKPLPNPGWSCSCVNQSAKGLDAIWYDH